MNHNWMQGNKNDLSAIKGPYVTVIILLHALSTKRIYLKHLMHLWHGSPMYSLAATYKR